MEQEFAKVWLDKLNNQILINNKDFFNENLEKLKKRHTITSLKNYINIGNSLIDDDELSEYAELSFADMKKKFGLTVYRITITKKSLRWKKLQKDILIIAPKKPGIPNEIPITTFSRRGLKIEWDRLNNAVRGLGENFGIPQGQYKGGDITPWVQYAKRKKGHNVNYLIKRKNYKEISDDLFDTWLGKEPTKNMRIDIKELPLMITEEGHLLCIPKTRVLPKILCVGKSGKGKSWSLNSMLGRVVYIFQDRAGLLNDSLNQFYDLMIPMKQTGFLSELQRIGNTGKPLPAINLYMSCPKVNIKYAEQRIGYRLVIGLKDFLYRWTYFAYGVKKWEIGSPEKYISKEIVNGLNECKTTKEAKDFLFSHFTEQEGSKLEKGKKAMIMKWVGAIDSIFRDEFTSNLFRHEETTSSKWKLLNRDGEELESHPFIISYEAGLIPVINNYLAKKNPIAKKQMSDLLKKIVEWQMEREGKQKRIWIFVDELKDFLGKKNDELYQALDYIFTQGRFNKIGFVGNVQEYTRLSASMRANSTHLIIFELQTNEERSAVAKDYNLDKEKVASMAQLKTFQCLITTKEKIVMYNKEGKKKEYDEGGMWRGKILPPISTHKSP